MSNLTSRNGSFALALTGVLIVALYFGDRNRHFYSMGKAVACKDDSVFEGVQAEILEYGLQDVRGLATDASGRYLYVAEANRPILIYDTVPAPGQSDQKHRDPGFINSPFDLTCRDGKCEDLDDRDIAIAGEEAFITENGKGRIFLRKLDKGRDLGRAELWDPKWADALNTPSGISVTQDVVFVSTDTPSRYARGTVPDPSKKGGALYVVCRIGDCQPDLIGATLQHPSGVVSRGPNGPVYVADDNEDSVRWLIYRKVADRGWIQDGLLASVPKSGETTPRFLGIAFSSAKQMIFAAGPTGIYAFDVHGASIGRMDFDEPVSGVAVSDKWLYLVVGHMLCRIPFDRVKETDKALRGLELLHPAPGQQDPAEPVLTPLPVQQAVGPTVERRPGTSRTSKKTIGSGLARPKPSLAKQFEPTPAGHGHIRRLPPSNRPRCDCTQKHSPEDSL